MPPAPFLVSRGLKTSNISRLAPKDFHFEFVDMDFVNKLFVAKVLVIRLYCVARSYLISIEEHLCFGIFGIYLRAGFDGSCFAALTIQVGSQPSGHISVVLGLIDFSRFISI